PYHKAAKKIPEVQGILAKAIEDAGQKKLLKELETALAERKNYTRLTIEIGKIKEKKADVDAILATAKVDLGKELMDLVHEKVKEEKTGFDAARAIVQLG